MKQTSILDQRGNTLVGFIAGLIVGLAIALGVAYVISKNSPEQKLNMRPAELGVAPKSSNSTNTTEVADVNQPLRNKAKPGDSSSADPVAAIVKKEETPPVSAPTTPMAPTSTEVAKSDTVYWVQLGAYGDKSTAESEKATFALQGVQTKLMEGKNDGQPIWRLRLGPFKTESEVQTSKSALESMGISYTVIKANKS